MGTMKTSNGGGGEIVQVQGGHIVRATGRKDRHSKVYTSKGPRDRRVRLSAHTAIQFYDVQDRLGFDRPSKAVDWLITKAKTSIDRLAHLPPFHPPAAATNRDEQPHCGAGDGAGYELAGGGDGGSSFLPPPELFFPAEQDLGLSLHSGFHGGGAAAMFAAPESDAFGSGGAYQRLMGWGGGAGLGFQSPPPQLPACSSGGFFVINQNVSQPLMRVPLQSSSQLSPPSMGGFDEFRRGRFVGDGFGFHGRGEEHSGGDQTQSASPNSGHHR